MTQIKKDTPQHWDAYWGGQGAAPNDRQHSSAVTGDAPGDKFDTIWRDFFGSVIVDNSTKSIADLACGAGIVLGRAVDAAKNNNCREGLFCGVDYSGHAASKIAARSQAGLCAFGVTASVDALPFPEARFDVVVSQFGIEYAPVIAFAEAARILAPGGKGQFIIHYQDGGIDRECAENFSVLDAILRSELFEAAGSAFDASRAAGIENRIMTIFATLRPRLQGAPSGAKETLARLLNDMSRLILRRAAFHPQEARAWIEASHGEVQQYAARMQAMTRAAMGPSDLKTALAMIAAQGVIVDEPEALMIEGKSLPAAWLLRLARAG